MQVGQCLGGPASGTRIIFTQVQVQYAVVFTVKLKRIVLSRIFTATASQFIYLFLVYFGNSLNFEIIDNRLIVKS